MRYVLHRMFVQKYGAVAAESAVHLAVGVGHTGFEVEDWGLEYMGIFYGAV